VFVLNCNFELGVLDECVAIAVINSMCTDLPVVHYFPYFVDQCTLRSAFCDYFMSTVFSFDVLLKWARRNDAVCIFESTKIPEIGGRGRRVYCKFVISNFTNGNMVSFVLNSNYDSSCCGILFPFTAKEHRG